MDCRRIFLTKHVVRRMQERQISLKAVFEVMASGEIIEERQEQGENVCILLGYPSGRALHVVVVHRPETGDCNVKTAYDPDPSEWSAGFRRRT